ncbi:MAG: TetR/AcrR family transcriptional regulator [Spirochaetia bacterium]|nr:TetR/AcrR family transcriptional regulator [Spirochaetia bacterium]
MNTKNITQEKLLIIAREILLNDGFTSFSIRNIAKKANVSIGSIYKYFPTKNDILITITAQSWNRILSLINSQENSSFKETIINIFTVLKDETTPIDGVLNHHNLFNSNDNINAKKMMFEYQKKIKLIIKTSLINEKDSKTKIDDELLENITNLIFDTLVNDVYKNTKNYLTLIDLITKY